LSQGAHELARFANFFIVELAIGVGVELADRVSLRFIAGGPGGRVACGWFLGGCHR
jgi:hypothetical protein